MKKFLLTFLVLGLLVLAAIAAIPYLTKVVGPDMMLESDPPLGVPFGYREFPIPERSLLAVKLDLPLSALETLANRDIPAQLTGVDKKDLHKKIKGATINWKMTPGNLSLRNTGRNLEFNIPFKGVANAKGKFGALKIGVKGTCQMGGNVSGDLTPTIGSNWQVSPNLTTALRVSHAVAHYGKNGSMECREQVEETLRPKIKQEEAKIGPSLTKALDMKNGVQTLWNKAHLIKEMSKDPNTWLVFDPALAQMGPIDYSNSSSVSITIGMVAQTFITNAEVQDRRPEEVPHLSLVPENPVTDIRVPIIANLRALNTSLADDQYLISTNSGAKIKVSHLNLGLADKGMLNLGLNISSVSGVWGNAISGTIQVQGKPMVDRQTQSFGFTDVKLSVDTREFISSTAAWLLEEILVKAIEREVRINLNDHLPKVENEIHKVVNSANVPEHLELFFDKPSVELIGVYTIEKNGWNEEPSPGIVFVFGAKGDIAVKLSKL